MAVRSSRRKKALQLRCYLISEATHPQFVVSECSGLYNQDHGAFAPKWASTLTGRCLTPNHSSTCKTNYNEGGRGLLNTLVGTPYG
eukprot:m.215291 g.215291  ORF g.215291 m.215291 type:complete len:86 (-) comp19091_c0_seq1:29-286(-)